MSPGPKEEIKPWIKPGFLEAALFAFSLAGFSLAIPMFWWMLLSSDCPQAVQRLQNLLLPRPRCQAHPSVANFLSSRPAILLPFARTHQLYQLGGYPVQGQDKINVAGVDRSLRHAEILRRGPVLSDDLAALLLYNLHSE